MMQCHQRAARGPISACVDLIWLCRNQPSALHLERVLPTGAPQLIVNLSEDRTRRYALASHELVCESAPGTIVTGALTEFDVIDTAEQTFVAGVAFKAGGLVPFTRVPACELRGLDVPVEALWGSQAVAVLREQLLAAATTEEQLDVLERSLIERWTARGHPAVKFALSVFQARPHLVSIAEVTRAIGLSPKRFIERFKAEVGMTPKRYCRVRRFQQALRRAHRGVGINWTEVALGAGYYDQAHFVHEFRRFSGLTPTEYDEARTPFQNHVKYLQSDLAAV